MFQKLLKEISLALNASSISYMIIGGQAVLLYGEPRLTKDIDITLGIGVDELSKIKKVIEGLNLSILVNNEEDFVKRTMVLPAKDKTSNIRIDFIFSFSPYEQEAIKRAKEIDFGGTPINFASLEDVIIHKIIAGRARDIEDIKSIMLKNPDYDKAYIERWLKEFDQSLDEDFSNTFRKTVEEIQ